MKTRSKMNDALSHSLSLSFFGRTGNKCASLCCHALVCLLYTLALLCTAVQSHAQSTNNTDPADLDYETNLVTPAVPEKQSAAVKTHMYKISEALQSNGFVSDFNRNDEVVTLTIPCSELFVANDTVIKPGGLKKLGRLQRLLKYPTMYKLIVAVYSDDTGEPQYCDGLTSARANAVEECLSALALEEGVSNANVVPYGMGQSDPRVENNTIDNRAVNRRVEINIVPEWEMIRTAKAGKLN